MPRPSPVEPLSALARVPIQECGEPLVDFLQLCPLLLLDRPRYDYQRSTLLRLGAAERLCRAALLLPGEFRLSVIEGWRSSAQQRLQYAATEQRLRREHPEWTGSRLRRAVNQLSAPPDGPAPAPHTTGGAVDVWLCAPDGTPLDLCSPYAPDDPRSYRFTAPRLAPAVTARRALLKSVMEQAGFTNYPCEYWHWSRGDQGWAYRGGHAAARYGATGPPE